MSYKAKFYVSCFATYPAEVDLPDCFFKEDGTLIASARDIIDYLESEIPNLDAEELEWVDDCDCDPIYSAEIIVDNKIKYRACVDGTLKTKGDVNNG